MVIGIIPIEITFPCRTTGTSLSAPFVFASHPSPVSVRVCGSLHLEMLPSCSCQIPSSHSSPTQCKVLLILKRSSFYASAKSALREVGGGIPF